MAENLIFRVDAPCPSLARVADETIRVRCTSLEALYTTAVITHWQCVANGHRLTVICALKAFRELYCGLFKGLATFVGAIWFAVPVYGNFLQFKNDPIRSSGHDFDFIGNNKARGFAISDRWTYSVVILACPMPRSLLIKAFELAVSWDLVFQILLRTRMTLIEQWNLESVCQICSGWHVLSLYRMLVVLTRRVFMANLPSAFVLTDCRK
jgi:hypothetical protein